MGLKNWAIRGSLFLRRSYLVHGSHFLSAEAQAPSDKRALNETQIHANGTKARNLLCNRLLHIDFLNIAVCWFFKLLLEFLDSPDSELAGSLRSTSTILDASVKHFLDFNGRQLLWLQSSTIAESQLLAKVAFAEQNLNSPKDRPGNNFSGFGP